MTSAALQDLSTRIASNTLTGPQQAALTTALAFLIPTFPSPDDLSDGMPSEPEEILARTWMAALYTLQAEASGGSTVLPTNQVAWYVNPQTGNDANDGTTPATAVASFDQIALRWRGVSGGGRPILLPATGTTITIHLLGDAANTDPLSAVLDVDIEASCSLIILGGAKAPAHAGTLATASAFVRTAAGGQISVTDVAVADFEPFLGTASLFVDSTTGGVSWLYSPFAGASATAKIFPARAALTPGTASFPALVATAATNGYTLSDCIHASLGSGWVTQSFPLESASANPAQVFVYRLHLVQPAVSENGVVVFQSPSAGTTFQECQLNHADTVELGGVAFVNCFHFGGAQILAIGGTANLQLLAGGYLGFTSGQVVAQQGAIAFIDLDFALVSGGAFATTDAGIILAGHVARWNNGGGVAIETFGGTWSNTILFDGGSTAYGTDAGGFFAQLNPVNGNAAAIVFFSGATAAAQFQFTDTAFSNGFSGASSFGFDNTAGTYVGPTTNTLAHVDAAIGAGTGFGKVSMNPQSGNTFRVVA